jgi:hypothetical protein
MRRRLLEFGSESFTMLMNFLTAFDLNSRNTAALKDTRFFDFGAVSLHHSGKSSKWN